MEIVKLGNSVLLFEVDNGVQFKNYDMEAILSCTASRKLELLQ
jgi:hypothetical protein